MEHNFFSLDWIPFKRHVLRLNIDEGKKIILGRFRNRKSAETIKKKLSAYQGYKLDVIDTKTLEAQRERGKAAAETPVVLIIKQPGFKYLGIPKGKGRLRNWQRKQT